MSDRTVEITSTTHALALAVYATQAVFGVAYLTHVNVFSSLTETIGRAWGNLWAIAMTASAVLCFIACLRSRGAVAFSLRSEMVGAIVLALCHTFYGAAFLLFRGVEGGVTTPGYAAMILVGCGARVWQIHVERKRLLAAISQQRAEVSTAVKDD